MFSLELRCYSAIDPIARTDIRAQILDPLV